MSVLFFFSQSSQTYFYRGTNLSCFNTLMHFMNTSFGFLFFFIAHFVVESVRQRW